MSMYATLDCAREEFRLLEIAPRVSNNANELLDCKLSVRSLADGLSYTALSYVWGDPQDTRPVLVNGSSIQATVNLVEALLQQRELGKYLLWADALCINQRDDAEKTEQIRMMATIYGCATNVVAWIGPSDETTHRTFGTIAEVSRLGQSSDPEIIERPNISMHSFARLVFHGENLVVTLRDDSTFRCGEIGSILSLLQKPYWSRLWTIQELCLARNASVTCGAYSIPWLTCKMAAVLLSTVHYARFGDGRELHEESFLKLCRPFDAKLCSWAGPRAAHISARLQSSCDGKLSMWHLLELTCNNTGLQAMDPKDRIYAIHGLLTRDDRAAITVDPHASCVDLYIQATLHLLARYGPRVFVFSTPIYRTSPSLQLPSWAVDWTCTLTRLDQEHDFITPLALPYPYRAAPSNTLILQAARIGCILTVMPFSGELDEMLDIIDHIEQSSLLHSSLQGLPDRRLQAWRALLSCVPNYNYGEIEWVDDFVRRRSKRPIPTHDTVPPNKSSSLVDSQSMDEEYESFRRKFPIVHDSVVFVTQKGLIGFAGAHLTPKVGDAVYAFPGYGYPFVLRPEQQESGGSAWSLVGKVKIEELVDVRFERVGELCNLKRFWEMEPKLEEVRLC